MNKEYAVSMRNKSKDGAIEVYMFYAEVIGEALAQAETAIRRQRDDKEIVGVKENN